MLLEQIWLEMTASWPSAFPGGGDRIRRPPPYVDPPPLAASLWYQWTLIFNSGFVGYPCTWPFRRCLNFRWDPADMLYNSWGDIQVSPQRPRECIGSACGGESRELGDLGSTHRTRRLAQSFRSYTGGPVSQGLSSGTVFGGPAASTRGCGACRA